MYIYIYIYIYTYLSIYIYIYIYIYKCPSPRRGDHAHDGEDLLIEIEGVPRHERQAGQQDLHLVLPDGPAPSVSCDSMDQGYDDAFNDTMT